MSATAYKIKRPDNTTIIQNDIIVLDDMYTKDGWYEIHELDSDHTNIFYIINKDRIICYYNKSYNHYWSSIFNFAFNSKEEFERAYKIKIFG